MKKYDAKLCKLISKKEIADGFFDFVVDAGELAKVSQAGQFAHIYIKGKTLRRPISICEINKDEETLRFVFQIRGEGTKELAEIEVGEMLDILAPLGNGFPLLDADKKALLIGGGIGVPPLLELAAYYKENAVVALGFRNKASVILADDFSAHGAKTLIATDDGSEGYNGLVTDMIKDESCDVIYACGPAPMLKSVCKLADEKGVQCYISLEERMACGVGACLGCACKLNKDGTEYYGHVCKDGPVFDYKEVCEL